VILTPSCSIHPNQFGPPKSHSNLDPFPHSFRLQRRIPEEERAAVGALPSHLAQGREGLTAWCTEQFAREPSSAWVVKDAGANGAAGIWVIGAGNWETILSEVGAKSQLAIQRYVDRPRLWRGRKVHLRCYVLLFGDGSSFLFQRALLHAANRPYTEPDSSTEAYDQQVHITNCCANSVDPEAFAGEIIFDLQAGDADFPACFEAIGACLEAHFTAAWPYMALQHAGSHFEFIGTDVMIDEDGLCWLLENNCPPCTETASGLPHAESFHDDVARGILEGFVVPALDARREPRHGEWVQVKAAMEGFEPSTSGGLNKLKWAMYCKSLAKSRW